MQEAVAADYRRLIAGRGRGAVACRRGDGDARSRGFAASCAGSALRDYFPPPEREQAQQAVDELAALVEEPVA